MKNYFKARASSPVPQIGQRMEGAYHRFLAGHEETKGVLHRGSKGQTREKPVLDFFESLLPQTFGVTSGEVIDFRGNTSPQSDLLVYRKSDGIPVLKDRPTILQVESVMSVTEVKSRITAEECRDCLRKVIKLQKLKPFDKPLQHNERNRNPTSEECRIFTAIFAYSSDIKGGLDSELVRFEAAANELQVDSAAIDRIYILGKGVINPAERSYAEDLADVKRGLFYFYSNMLQFLIRESKRRKPVPYIQYFGRMSEGWKRVR